jgi:hypothetical protein
MPGAPGLLVAEADIPRLHERSAQADIAFPEPRIHSPGGETRRGWPRPERVNPPLGLRQALSRADALCEQGFRSARDAMPGAPGMRVAEADIPRLHERSAQADIAFPLPRIHSPGGDATGLASS